MGLYTAAYAPNRNILTHSDSGMGTRAFSYDAVDRLSTAMQTASTVTSTQYAPNSPCWYWTYDRGPQRQVFVAGVEDFFGNRTLEAFSATPCGSNPTPQVWTSYNSSSNRIWASSMSPATVAPGSLVYDASGNTLYGGINHIRSGRSGARPGTGQTRPPPA